MLNDEFDQLMSIIKQIDVSTLDENRKQILQSLIDYIQLKVDKKEEINLNFICTHNSRRSHLAQIWAQTAAHYFDIPKVKCYSGGTVATAIYPAIIDILKASGFEIEILTKSSNSKYSIRFSKNQEPIIAFSKKWNNSLNPKEKFCAVMTCSEADVDCPVVFGAEKRIPIHYNDPKEFDDSSTKLKAYRNSSLKIAAEMVYVFSQIK